MLVCLFVLQVNHKCTLLQPKDQYTYLDAGPATTTTVRGLAPSMVWLAATATTVGGLAITASLVMEQYSDLLWA